jgi:hypothetical protein
MHDILGPGGVHQCLQNFHRGKVYIISIEPIRGFQWKPFDGKNVYVDFSVVAHKWVKDKASQAAARVNTQFMSTIEAIMADHGQTPGLEEKDKISKIIDTIVKYTDEHTNFSKTLTYNIQRVWETRILPHYFPRFKNHDFSKNSE